MGRREPTIKDLQFHVDPGERVLLVGASGSGKSTLLHALTGALGETITGDLTGSVEVGGRLGLVGQNPADSIVADRIGRDVAFGPENIGLPRDEIRSRVATALEAVDLSHGVDHFTAALSGGEQQRLVLAGVLAMRPDVMALDEPTSMLDDDVAAEVRSAVVSTLGERTLIVVEHRFEAWLEHVDRVVVLDSGMVAFDGAADRFRAEVANASWGGALWWPGRPAPTPVELPSELVGATGQDIELSEVSVELVSRTLRGSQRVRAIKGLTASCTPGQTTAFVGPSGSGKSTALLAIAGLVKPSSGTIVPNRAELRPRDLAVGLGWVPQNPEHGFLTTRVCDEVELTARRVGRTVDTSALLAAVGLERFAQAHPFRLSGGEQRRLALAAALAHRPGLVVADEPTVGQDPQSWALVSGWLAAAATHGSTVVVSTHDALLPRNAEIRLGAFA